MSLVGGGGEEGRGENRGAIVTDGWRGGRRREQRSHWKREECKAGRLFVNGREGGG